MTLVPNWIREIIPINIAEVILFWNLTVWDFCCRFVCFAPVLRFCKHFAEFFSILSNLFVSLCLNKTLIIIQLQHIKNILSTMSTIIFVVYLEFTHIGLPSEVIFIN